MPRCAGDDGGGGSGGHSGLDADAMYWDTSNGALQFQDSVKIYMGPTSTSVASTQPGPGAGLQIEGNSTYGLILGTNNITIRSGSFSDSGKTINLEAKTKDLTSYGSPHQRN
mgnify:CR=1 FL=1